MEEKKDLAYVQSVHRLQMKANRDKIKERKERTHRLIVRGAIAETVIAGSDKMTDEQFQDALFNAVNMRYVAPGPLQESHGSDRR